MSASVQWPYKSSLFMAVKFKLVKTQTKNVFHCATAKATSRTLRHVQLMGQTLVNSSLRCLHGPAWLTDVHDLPRKKQRKISEKHPHLVDEDIACEVAKVVRQHVHPDNPTYECNPGEGILSQALLQEGVRRLVLWEANPAYWQKLQDIAAQYKETLDIQPLNFFQTQSIPKGSSVDVEGRERNWKNAVGVYVVGSLDPAQIMPWTTCCHQAMGRKTFPYHRGRAEFLLLVTGREHQLMTDPEACEGMRGPRPRRIISYQLFYDISTLQRIPVSAFENIPKMKITKTSTWDPGSMYLVRMIPKQNLFETVCPPTDFPTFLDFFKQLYRAQRARLIPRLEEWAPGIGLTAIDLGYSMMDTVKQLHAHHFPVIFRAIQEQGGFDGKSLVDSDTMYNEDTLVGLELPEDSGHFEPVKGMHPLTGKTSDLDKSELGDKPKYKTNEEEAHIARSMKKEPKRHTDALDTAEKQNTTSTLHSKGKRDSAVQNDQKKKIEDISETKNLTDTKSEHKRLRSDLNSSKYDEEHKSVPPNLEKAMLTFQQVVSSPSDSIKFPEFNNSSLHDTCQDSTTGGVVESLASETADVEIVKDDMGAGSSVLGGVHRRSTSGETHMNTTPTFTSTLGGGDVSQPRPPSLDSTPTFVKESFGEFEELDNLLNSSPSVTMKSYPKGMSTSPNQTRVGDEGRLNGKESSITEGSQNIDSVNNNRPHTMSAGIDKATGPTASQTKTFQEDMVSALSNQGDSKPIEDNLVCETSWSDTQKEDKVKVAHGKTPDKVQIDRDGGESKTRSWWQRLWRK